MLARFGTVRSIVKALQRRRVKRTLSRAVLPWQQMSANHWALSFLMPVVFR